MNAQPRLRKLLLVLLAIAAGVTLMIAMFFWSRNVRGKADWRACEEKLKSAGVPVEYASLIPSPIPDHENFAATPFIQLWFDATNHLNNSYDADSVWRDDYKRVSETIPDRITKGARQFIDLAEWANAFQGSPPDLTQPVQSNVPTMARNEAAVIVLKGLESSAVHLTELREASGRSSSRYPVQYNLDNPLATLLPHLANVRAATLRLKLKACAELTVGQSDRALEDINLMLHLNDSINSEPLLISYLVRIACLNMTIQPIWEGLMDHRWTAPQLEHLHQKLAQLDFVADLRPILNAERAMGISTAEAARKKGLSYMLSLSEPSFTPNTVIKVADWFVPSGWYYQEAVSYCRLFDLLTDDTYDVTNRRVFPDQVEANTAALASEFDKQVSVFREHKYLARILVPSLSKVLERAAKAQIMTDHAIIACTLERFRLAEGKYPESLEALAPRFISSIPNDPITGEPYKYRPANEGRFTLYSLWWNQTDEGGTPAENREGDIVWSRPLE